MDFRALLAVVFSAAMTLAQTTLVLPQSHATRDGSSATNVPFGRSTPCRVQQIYDGRLFAGPGTILRFDLRLDELAAAAGKQVDCEIRMSTLPMPLVQFSADFANNRGADETIVLPRQLLTLPAIAAAAPAPFALQVPLAVPFVYDPARGALVVEITVFGQPPGAYSLDATYVCDSPEVAFGPAACAQPGGNPLRVESATTQVIWGRPWVTRVLDALPGALTVLVLGTTDQGPWGGFTLPVDLGVVGAPGCFLSTDVAAVFLQQALGDGSATYAFVIPENPAVVGLWLHYQAGALNGNANAVGLVTSQAKKAVVCGFEPVGRVWASGLAATTGAREIGVAPVAQVVLQ